MSDINFNSESLFRKVIHDSLKVRTNQRDTISPGLKTAFSDIELKLKDMNRDFHLKDCGSGVISMAIIAMHLVLAEINHTNVVFGIEEPEINLHPIPKRISFKHDIEF